MVITAFFKSILTLFTSGRFDSPQMLFSTDPQCAANPKFSSLKWHEVNNRRYYPNDNVYLRSSLSIPTGACGEHKLGGLWSQ
jgi:hypothetical protein